jgi:hypothetical protein|tara:strand:+ start:238 stop:507 length:270 start_codon:yes stop_codon:yes gene_type:complete
MRDLDEQVTEYGLENAIRMEPAEMYDSCVIGVLERFGQPSVLLYDKSKVLDTLMGDGADYGEALEYYGYNQLGAWFGDGTPGFLVRLPE